MTMRPNQHAANLTAPAAPAPAGTESNAPSGAAVAVAAPGPSSLCGSTAGVGCRSGSHGGSAGDKAIWGEGTDAPNVKTQAEVRKDGSFN
jgi:hypothetical protein